MAATIEIVLNLIIGLLTDKGALATILTGGVAIFLYWKQQRNEKRNAAIMLVLDIRNAEQRLNTLLDTKAVQRKKMQAFDTWDKQRHLLASDLSYDKISLITRFFDEIKEISDANNEYYNIFYASITAKAAVVQEELIKLRNTQDQQYDHEKAKIIKTANEENFIFDPDEPRHRIFYKASYLGKLSGTTAFSKLTKIAGLK